MTIKEFICEHFSGEDTHLARYIDAVKEGHVYMNGISGPETLEWDCVFRLFIWDILLWIQIKYNQFICRNKPNYTTWRDRRAINLDMHYDGIRRKQNEIR